MKQKTKQIKLLIVIFMVPLIIVLPFSFLHATTLEEELEQVNEKLEETQEKIEIAKQEEKDYKNQVIQVENDLVQTLGELDGLNSRLHDVKSNLDRITIELVIKDKELSDLEESLQEKIEIYNDRILQIYKKRDRDFLDILFNSENFLVFFSRLKMMNLIAKRDIEVIEQIEIAKDELINVQASIADLKDQEKNKKNEVERLVLQTEDKRDEVENIFSEKNRLLTQATANKNALIAMEEELESEAEEITKKLEALKYGNIPTGRLTYPTAGVLTSGFGYRISPISGTQRFHYGIDIGARHGTPIVAAAEGDVIQVGYISGYGHSVLIYHGGGYATFYAHMSGYAISSGQHVKRGQTIGYIGSTGYATGPHLHFEVRINGVPHNPLEYL